MNSSTVNFTTPEASTNSTIESARKINTTEMFVYSISILFGLPVHSYIMWLIVTGKRTGNASEFFNLNISMCDIGNSLSCLFAILGNWFSSLRTFSFFLLGLLITGRPLFQCLICVERYLAVVHPVTFLKLKPLRYRVICSTAAWILTFSSCLCCMITLMLSKFAYSYFFSLQFLLFLSIQLFCLSAVLRALKQSGPGERGREREEENNLKKRAFYLILITNVNMVITYVPYIITGFFTILNIQIGNIRALWDFCFLCFMLTGFLHPVLYLHRFGKLSCLCSP
ncbi:G-protein coupled receptor 4-like [Myxocyprinus asiaticus]|uniref:G-protein coupled receptor 4-like n=1 Tax=Myxocyprinus asiaticus TaxID=70543 RepID=UPI0022231615|nr:G-protein coupled receptor 4-like [Myxocyprinus asiaticus]